MIRRRSVLALLPLAACAGHEPSPPAAPDPEPPPGTPALRLVAGPRRALLLPVHENGARRVWRADGVALATDGPRVTATAGLGQRYEEVRVDGTDPVADLRAVRGRLVTLRRLVDLHAEDRDPAAARFGLSLVCRLATRSEAGTLVAEESCTGSGLAFTNRFWAEAATGQVLRSEQWAGDGVPPLALEHLSPAS